MEWCGVFMMGLWASGLRSLRPLASTHSVPRLTTPSFSPHINPFRKNSKLKQNILWFGLSFVQISCRKIRSFPFLVDFHSFLPKRARKYHFDSYCLWEKVSHSPRVEKMAQRGHTIVLAAKATRLSVYKILPVLQLCIFSMKTMIYRETTVHV